MTRSSGFEIFAAMVALAFAILGLAGKPESKDYIAYWSAGTMLRHHADPYSVPEVLALEKGLHYSAERPLVMRNPPPSLFLALPLGFTAPRVGLMLWLAAALACMAASLAVLHAPYRGVAWCFMPFLFCLITGQSSPFLLLGLSLFLAWERRRPLWAGAGLLLLAMKPHVLFLLWPLLLLECVYHRKFRLLAGFAMALAAATAFAFVFDPHVFAHYLTMLHADEISNAFLPTPAFMLRYAVDVNRRWLQLVPAAVACVWAVWFYFRNRDTWDWQTHTMPLLFASVLTSPYVWFTDEVVLLPAILLTLATTAPRKHPMAVLLALNAIPFALLMARVNLTSGAYVWTSAAWFAWYLYCRGPKVMVEPTDRLNTVSIRAPA